MDYSDIGKDIGGVVNEKQKAYGDSFGKAHRILLELYPNGISPDQYSTILTMARVIDKMFRIATNNDPFGENPWKDIAGYAILEVGRKEKKS